MLAILFIILVIIVAFIAGIVIWKFCGGEKDKYDPKLHRDILDLKSKREEAMDLERTLIKRATGKTRRAIEDDYRHDMGEHGFKQFMRGLIS